MIVSRPQIKVVVDLSDKIHEYFEMQCDLCAIQFTSLQHARLHYFDDHQSNDGYIKCCGIKFKTDRSVNDHIRFHLDPEKYR